MCYVCSTDGTREKKNETERELGDEEGAQKSKQRIKREIKQKANEIRWKTMKAYKGELVDSRVMRP